MKKIILAAVVLALSSGAAMADRFHGGGGGRGHAQGGVVVHNNGGGYHGGGHVVVNGGYHGRGGYSAPRYYHSRGVARANIWMPRPVIRSHYYHYGYRPALIGENYGYREGYVFVRGDWQWNGYEWMWQPGHYEPDAAYVEVY